MNDVKRLQDIIKAIEAVETYKLASYDEFEKDSKTQDAIFFNMSIIGEASNQLSEEFREQYHQVPWSSMIGTRNVIVHGYDQVKLQIVWEIIQRDLTNLKTQLLDILTNSSKISS
jgi:uncharacterized protein with HEPN domain